MKVQELYRVKVLYNKHLNVVNKTEKPLNIVGFGFDLTELVITQNRTDDEKFNHPQVLQISKQISALARCAQGKEVHPG